jgi:hypothetical protein
VAHRLLALGEDAPLRVTSDGGHVIVKEPDDTARKDVGKEGDMPKHEDGGKLGGEVGKGGDLGEKKKEWSPEKKEWTPEKKP